MTGGDVRCSLGGPKVDLQTRAKGCGYAFEQVESGIVIGMLQASNGRLAQARSPSHLGLR